MNLKEMTVGQSQTVSAMSPEQKEQTIRNIVKTKQHDKIDGVLVDMTTAGGMVQLLDKLTPDQKQKYLKLPIQKMANVLYKVMK